MNRVQVLGALVAGACATGLVAAAVAPAEPDDGILGGPPLTTPASSTCSDGEFARGIGGFLGEVAENVVVGAVFLPCMNGASAATMGGVPFSPTEFLCPEGMVAVGIHGAEGDFIDSIGARCQDESLSGPVESGLVFGGPGGTSDGPYDCPEGEALVGLTGTITDDGIAMVRNVSIVCAAPADTQTTLTVKTPGKKVKVTGDVSPQQNGSKVTVVLSKKKKGGFRKVAQAKPTLGPPSEFKATFRAPKAKTCKVTATFAGDVNSNPSAKTKRFRC